MRPYRGNGIQAAVFGGGGSVGGIGGGGGGEGREGPGAPTGGDAEPPWAEGRVVGGVDGLPEAHVADVTARPQDLAAGTIKGKLST